MLTQIYSFIGKRDAHITRAGVERRFGGRDKPMTVRVCLHDAQNSYVRTYFPGYLTYVVLYRRQIDFSASDSHLKNITPPENFSKMNVLPSPGYTAGGCSSYCF